MSSTHIIFEQPVSEYIRVCLKLEQLFNCLDLNDYSSVAANQKMIALARILEVIDRPDLKSKLTQALTQLSTTLSQLGKSPQVDSATLQRILSELNLSSGFLLNNCSMSAV